MTNLRRAVSSQRQRCGERIRWSHFGACTYLNHMLQQIDEVDKRCPRKNTCFFTYMSYMYIFMHSMYCIYLGVHLGKNTSGWIVQCCLCILSEPCAATMFDQPTLPPPHHGSVKSGRKSSQIARCLSRSFHFFHWPMIVFERSGGHPRTHSGVTSTHRTILHHFSTQRHPRTHHMG